MRVRDSASWLVAGLLTAAVTVSGQPSAPAKAEDMVPALLAEVRGLRAAMEQMASAGPRVQLFTSRLQLQEARINNMVRRHDAVRESLTSAQGSYDRVLDEITRFEASLNNNPSGPHRQELEQMLPQRKRESLLMKRTLDRLTAEEAQLAQDIVSEQGRWTEINQRLDELERALTRR
jgi:hypothetical protein